jgi:hypothetical protein
MKFIYDFIFKFQTKNSFKGKSIYIYNFEKCFATFATYAFEKTI